jgi:hypothetical protein
MHTSEVRWSPYAVVNTAPWILSVAASTIDRAFRSSVILSEGTVMKVITPFANGN